MFDANMVVNITQCGGHVTTRTDEMIFSAAVGLN
jgi:hypothetical protein